MRYLLLFTLFFGFLQAEEESQSAQLQASISVTPMPMRPEGQADSFGKIQPGTPIKVVVTVKNVGTLPNAPGRMVVRYMFPEPLASQPQSLLFQTEPVVVPAITPGQEVALTFSAGNNWPSLFDFIRYDWGMRQFQAVFLEDNKEEVLGIMSILFSAYYYQGPSKEISVKVPEQKKEVLTKPHLTRNGERNTTQRRSSQRKEIAGKF